MRSRPVEVPDPSLVLLVGPAGCGKSTLAARHFAPGAVLSSDLFRRLVAGDEDDQSATPDAFALLRSALEMRARRRRLTVVDATNVVRRDRARALDVAERYDLPAVAIVLDLPLETCQRRAATRTERIVGPDVVADQHVSMRRHLGSLAGEGFAQVVVLSSAEEIAALDLRLTPEPARP